MRRGTPPEHTVPERADVVIVGGGVIGTSAAFHLAEAGVGEVVLVERGVLGEGSTSKAAGGVRAQFSDEINIQLGARSLDAFRDFPERPGQEIDLRQVGYLFLLSRERHVRAFERSIELQHEFGVPSRLVGVDEAVRLSPLIRPDGLLAAAYSPDDGHCSPESVVLGYATGARRHGARIVTHCEVLGIETSGGEINAVETGLGTIRTPAVVCAAGAWSAAIGAMAGVALPVTPLRRQAVVTEPLPWLTGPVPMTIDLATAFYFHREGRGLLVGRSDPDERPGFRLERTDDWLPGLAAAIEARAPALMDAGIATGWAGLYEVSPDHNAMIGRSGGFLYATGFSGHGFLQGPAAGEIIRDLYLGRTPFVDVTPLSADRFASRQDRPETAIV
jgi:sarcosine oxidase subunit beta